MYIRHEVITIFIQFCQKNTIVITFLLAHIQTKTGYYFTNVQLFKSDRELLGCEELHSNACNHFKDQTEIPEKHNLNEQL